MVSAFLGYLLPFLFVLALVVFVHEMGHFLVGRWLGVKVETFSLGFGPRIARIYDRRGTEWALSAIPLGGYVGSRAIRMRPRSGSRCGRRDGRG